MTFSRCLLAFLCTATLFLADALQTDPDARDYKFILMEGACEVQEEGKDLVQICTVDIDENNDGIMIIGGILELKQDLTCELLASVRIVDEDDEEIFGQEAITCEDLFQKFGKVLENIEYYAMNFDGNCPVAKNNITLHEMILWEKSYPPDLEYRVYKIVISFFSVDKQVLFRILMTVKVVAKEE